MHSGMWWPSMVSHQCRSVGIAMLRAQLRHVGHKSPGVLKYKSRAYVIFVIEIAGLGRHDRTRCPFPLHSQIATPKVA